MTHPIGRDRRIAAADASGPRGRVLATILLAGLAAVVAAGCLPGGTRGSGGADSARATGSAAPAITASPAPTGPTPRPSFVPPTPTPEPTFVVYVVARGDSLNSIAHRFGTTGRSIAYWNRSTYPSLDPDSAGYRPGLLKIGWTLFVRPNDIVDEQDLPDPSDSATDELGPPIDSAAPG